MGSNPVSVQVNGDPAAMVPATIQTPNAIIPTEIRSENVISMLVLFRASNSPADSIQRARFRSTSVRHQPKIAVTFHLVPSAVRHRDRSHEVCPCARTSLARDLRPHRSACEWQVAIPGGRVRIRDSSRWLRKRSGRGALPVINSTGGEQME